MSGGTRRHYLISERLKTRLAVALAGKGCEAFSGGVPIKTPSLPPYRYPDASVVCGELIFENIGGIDTVTNPILVVEVLSPGTEHMDKEPKRSAYQQIPSVREYLIISQDAPHITQYVRQGRRWARRDFSDLAALLELPSINSHILIGDIYKGITFD
jgi:Uma2 family endonuclease